MARDLRLFSRPAFEPKLTKAARKLQGIYYTPPEIVRQMVELTIRPMLAEGANGSKSLQILDPSCGAGEFLVAALQRVSESRGAQVAREGLWGVDIDREATQTARSRLVALDRGFPVSQIVDGDALTTRRLSAGSFDAVIGNPPYVNIRQLAKALARDKIDALRESFLTARGNFDLYVLFLERALELLRPGGRCGFIIPSKWATLDYARECRKMLLTKTTIEHVIDLSNSRVFAAASVYPHILVFKKAAPASSHSIRVSGSDQQAATVRQAGLCEQAIALSAPLDVESRVATAPLGLLARISCGTAGYAAQKARGSIFEQHETTRNDRCDSADFITSGNIDRYGIRLGDVRYLNRRYARPKLLLTGPELTDAKRELFRSPKIVVAGMCRRLEAAWDGEGLALGVQVFALSEFQVDPFYLLGLLNSKLLSYLFATRFAAKRLGGGYLAINKGQLVRLPIPIFDAPNRSDARKAGELAEIARKWSPTDEDRMDQLAYALFCVSDAEVDRIERHFSTIKSLAA